MIERPKWDEYFLHLAETVSDRSTCLRRRYGAVIVDDDNRIVSTGYNGAPRGSYHCTDIDVCYRKTHNIPKGEQYERCRAVHAEANAINYAHLDNNRKYKLYIVGKNVEDDSYASGEPCLLCQKDIINSKISSVIYWDENKKKRILGREYLIAMDKQRVDDMIAKNNN